MIVACCFCRSQDLPSVQRELPRFSDMRVLWTLCVLHREEVAAWRRAAEAFTARLRAPAVGEAGA